MTIFTINTLDVDDALEAITLTSEEQHPQVVVDTDPSTGVALLSNSQSSDVSALNQTSIRLRGNAVLRAENNVTVDAGEEATVHAVDDAIVVITGGTPTVRASDRAKVTILENSGGVLYLEDPTTEVIEGGEHNVFIRRLYESS